MEVPASVVAELGMGKKRRVRVTVGGHTYRSTVAVQGGRYLLPLSAANRAAAGVAAGDDVEVDVEPDTEPREVAVPDDLRAALGAAAAAREAFEQLSYGHQLRHVLAIEDARTPETRQRRVGESLEMLRSGRR